jgi:hypothetical protein
MCRDNGIYLTRVKYFKLNSFLHLRLFHITLPQAKYGNGKALKVWLLQQYRQKITGANTCGVNDSLATALVSNK